MKILVVDDSVFSQKINANFIKKYIHDAEIHFADNGKNAFEKYKQLNPDYIIVDLLMPIINGQDLIRLIKEYRSDAKIIVVTADVQKSIREEVEACGVMLFVNKPMNQEKAETISDIIRKGIK
ncbi:response regulator [Petroclostridium sp. X23]|uniref:response regulator transcription factor n=1 Tax=Petroclostridium sp. X23 TaxID=3045146 RepID=UPI0024AD6C91|nr:response regulator [Petroclostridium sp. X23]WHH59406.1 response regulator [Petroclostridium sp. X23]